MVWVGGQAGRKNLSIYIDLEAHGRSCCLASTKVEGTRQKSQKQITVIRHPHIMSRHHTPMWLHLRRYEANPRDDSTW